VLHDLRDRADFLRPYELLERALTRHGGRMRLIARLGAEAEDGIDQLLAQALAQEAVAIPDLTGFLQWLETGETEVRRQPDGAGRKLRVMTVHGAKGLQAPIVILPDTADRQNRDRDPVVDLEDGVPGWKMPAGAQPEPLAAAVQARGERAAQERLRLLYVAMTRAEVWLIVAAAGAVTQPEAWHCLVSAGLEAGGAVPFAMPTGPGLRLSNGTWPEDLGAAQGMAATTPLALPDWTDRPAQAVPQGPAGIRWIRPSGLGGAKIVTPTAAPHDPNAAQAAMAEGSRVHHLLEHFAGLGAEDRALAAARLRAADPTIDAALDQVLGLLANADILAALMPTPPAEALTEVMLTAPHGPGHILGAVDRLVVAPDRVLALDFKTNRDVPDSPDAVPEGILRQMGAYRAALRQIWPDRPVGCAVVWTQAPARLMPLPDALIDEAFARAALDGEAGAS
jgi:ATP-dependent helicase/nuclease subunit A